MTIAYKVLGFTALGMATAATAQLQSAQVTPFEAVSIEGGGQVSVRPGSRHGYRIVAGSPGALIITSQRNRGLRIRCRQNACHGQQLRIEVTAPRVTAFAVHGGGTMRIERGFAPIDSIALAVHGGGLIDSRAIAATNVAASVHGGGTVLTLGGRNLAASVHGGGNIVYSGAPANVATSVNGGGSVTRSGSK
jgi:hypothetical protein